MAEREHRDFLDIGRIIDDMFDAAEDFTNVFKDTMSFPQSKVYQFRTGEKKDFYPLYSYPPANVYMTEEKTMVFEFALAGFREEDINLEFRGDYMIFSATVAEDMKPEQGVRYFKRRLKLKDINEQKYYVPADKFDQEATTAVFRNGILRVTVPPREAAPSKEGVKIDITSGEEADKQASSDSTSRRNQSRQTREKKEGQGE